MSLFFRAIHFHCLYILLIFLFFTRPLCTQVPSFYTHSRRSYFLFGGKTHSVAASGDWREHTTMARKGTVQQQHPLRVAAKTDNQHPCAPQMEGQKATSQTPLCSWWGVGFAVFARYK